MATDLRSEWSSMPTCTALEEPDLVAIAHKDYKLLGAKLPGTEALQQMYVKAQLYKQGGDHMSSVIYASMALWSYRAQVSDPKELNADVENMFLGIIRKGREDLLEQFKKASNAGEDDLESFAPQKPEDMQDKFTKKEYIFQDLAGMDREKKELTEQFLHPNKYPFLYYGDVNNVLLYGPPGTGKTYIARAVANEFSRSESGTKSMDMKMFIAAGDSLRSKWEGGTEKNIAALFRTSESVAEKHKGPLPCKSVVFLDEVESVAKSRALDPQNVRSVTTLLQQIDGPISLKHTLVMAATNLPWQLDTAFLRRFTSKIFVDVPDFSDRAELLCTIICKKIAKNNRDIFQDIAITDDVDAIEDSFVGKFQEYKKMFESDTTTIEEFVPELVTIMKEELKDKTHATSKLYMEAMELHTRDFKEKAKVQLNFLSKFRTEDMKCSFTDDTSMYDSEMTYSRWYQSSPLTAEDTEDIETMHQKVLPLRTYIRLFAQHMLRTKLPTEIPAKSRPEVSYKHELSEFEKVCVLCHYVAEVTGPSPLLRVIGDLPNPDCFIPNKKVSHLSNNIFGYSNSDMDKVIGYVFSTLASKVIESRVDEDKTVCSGNKREKLSCKGRMYFDGSIDSTKKYDTIPTAELTGSDTFILNGNKNAYVTIDPEFFKRALASYATTTGEYKTMFDYYCFRGRQSDEEPGCKDEFMKRINHLRSNPEKEEKSE